MLAKAAGILIALIVVGVATTHSHAARPSPTCPATSTPKSPPTHTTAER